MPLLLLSRRSQQRDEISAIRPLSPSCCRSASPAWQRRRSARSRSGRTRCPPRSAREVDGNAALETVRELSRFHRVHGSPGFAAAAEHMLRDKLSRPGSPTRRSSGSRRTGRRATRTSAATSAGTRSPRRSRKSRRAPRLIASFPDAAGRARRLQPGRGRDRRARRRRRGHRPRRTTRARTFAERSSSRTGPLPSVHRRACEERGAAGFLSDFPNQTTAWSGDDRDLVRWGHLSPYQTAQPLRVHDLEAPGGGLPAAARRGRDRSCSARRVRGEDGSRDFRRRLRDDSGNGSRGAARSFSRRTSATSRPAPTTTRRAARRSSRSRGRSEPRSRGARCRGRGARSGSSGSPRSPARRPGSCAIRRSRSGSSPASTWTWSAALLSTTKGTFHLSRTAESLPHVVERDRARLVRPRRPRVGASTRSAAATPSPGSCGRPARARRFSATSARSRWEAITRSSRSRASRVPMVYFHDWPDVTIHTNKDQPENLDATKLGRVAYMGAGIAWTLAALPGGRGGGRLAELARAEADRRHRHGARGRRLPAGRFPPRPAGRRGRASARFRRSRTCGPSSLDGSPNASRRRACPRRDPPRITAYPGAKPRRARARRRLLLRPDHRERSAPTLRGPGAHSRGATETCSRSRRSTSSTATGPSRTSATLSDRARTGPSRWRRSREYFDLLARARAIAWR